MNIKIDFDNSYSWLPENFYERVKSTNVGKPQLIQYNESLAQELGLDFESISNQELADFFSGNILAEWSEPIAQVYAGHQFGYFNPRLGDGRAMLLWELIDKEGNRKDIQLKWSGRTRFSRTRSDGKAPLWAVIREYILSEAMNALGAPTTRALAMVKTWEEVYRERIEPGAIITRVASSHIRIGTFEYFAHKKDYKSIKILTDYVIDRDYPEVKNNSNPYLSFFEAVIDKQVKLVAKWMNLGFIHGVMNTDNTSISWETIDYGPCAFMDEYHRNTVFSFIDRDWRYAFENQKYIIGWNLMKLWESIIHLIDSNEKKSVDLINNALSSIAITFDEYWLDGMKNKIGIINMDDGDEKLIRELLEMMERGRVDYTLFFRYLSNAVETWNNTLVKKIFERENEIDTWLSQWNKRLEKQGIGWDQLSTNMKQVNPAFIPRNHRVQQAIDEAINKTDFILMNQLLEILKNPYADQPEYGEYMNPPKEDERVHQTFCGT